MTDLQQNAMESNRRMRQERLHDKKMEKLETIHSCLLDVEELFRSIDTRLESIEMLLKQSINSQTS